MILASIGSIGRFNVVFIGVNKSNAEYHHSCLLMR